MFQFGDLSPFLIRMDVQRTETLTLFLSPRALPDLLSRSDSGPEADDIILPQTW